MSVTIGELQKTIENLVDSGNIRLPIESGQRTTGGDSAWIKVIFSSRFNRTPAVNVTGEFKSAKLKQYKVDIPSIEIPEISLPVLEIPTVNIPDLTIPTLPFEIPRISLIEQISGYESVAKYMGEEMRKSFMEWSEFWQYSIVLIPIREGIAGLTYLIGYFMGSFFDWFVNNYIQPSIDNVQNVIKDIKDRIDNELIGKPTAPAEGSLNALFDEIEVSFQEAIDEVTVGVNSGVKSLRDEIQFSFDSVRNEVNTGTKAVEIAVEDSINNQISRLFDFLGVADGQPIVPVKVRNVTPEGFEFYSTGSGIYYWSAICL